MDSTRRAFDPWLDRLESDGFSRPSHLDQYLGAGGWDADELLLPTSRLYSRYRSPRMMRPSSWVPECSTGEKSISKDMFSVKLDVHQFTPNEVTVKTKDQNQLIIEAKHEEREDDHGFIARSFSRRYQLPDDVKLDQLVCNMSIDGIITIEAPRKVVGQGGETMIPIRQTGRPAVVPTAPTTPTPKPASQSTNTTNASANREPRTQTIQIEREATPQSPS